MSTSRPQSVRVRPHSQRRGFALPLVFLLGSIVIVAIGILLERSGQGRLTAQREVSLYQDHHRQAGMREVLAVYLGTQKSRLEEAIDEDGTGFKLHMEDGTEVTVKFSDAQGTILADSAAYTRQMEVQEKALKDLVELAKEGASGGGTGQTGTTEKDKKKQSEAWEEATIAAVENLKERAASGFRRRGPVPVSVNSAPREVIEAIFFGVNEDLDASEFCDAVEKRQTGIKMSSAEIGGYLTRVRGMRDEDNALLRAMLTGDCQYWKVEATTMSLTGETIKVQEGLVQCDGKGGIGGNGTWTILAWAERDRPRR